MAGYLRNNYAVSTHRACRVAGIARSSWYYASRLDDGGRAARSRVLRVYRAMGLEHPPRTRVFGVVDEYPRGSLALGASLSYPSERVCRILDRVAGERGAYPTVLRTDNGPEFIAGALAAWCEEHEVRHVRITPGRPMENGRIERFNRTVREDVLDFWRFASFRDLNAHLTAWQRDYDTSHPHTALSGHTPASYGREEDTLAITH